MRNEARTAFTNSSHLFTHLPRLAVFPRILNDFACLEVLRSADFEKWREIRFDNLQCEGLGKVLFDRKDYTTFTQVKTANNSTFDILVASFPHTGYKITHTADELPPRIQDDLFDAVGYTAEAIRKTAEQTGKPLTRLYVGEQFFFDELNDYPFKNTFPQTHIHVSGITKEDFHNTRRPTYAEFYGDPQTKHSFRDPTIFVAQDLYREVFPKENPVIDIHTASLVISKETIGGHLEISPESRKKYMEIMKGFKKMYREVASCFTAFNKDEYGRNIPLGKTERITNVNRFIENHQSLTDNSRLILQHIAENLEGFDPEKLYRAFYNNFAGHIGWTFNFEDNTSTLRFAPRTFTESHGYGETDGDYFAIKDRSINIKDDDRERVLQFQRLVIGNMSPLNS